MESHEIDWSEFDRFSEDTMHCRCGVVFRSHGKTVLTPHPHHVTRKPCPGCWKNNDIRRVVSDPEEFTIRR